MRYATLWSRLQSVPTLIHDVLAVASHPGFKSANLITEVRILLLLVLPKVHQSTVPWVVPHVVKLS